MSERPLALSQVSGEAVSIAGPAGQLTYRFGDLPKACLHPLTTPGGRVISGFEMSDHVWHRGLWFTIKFINGTNFWEEHEPFGVQVHANEPTVEVLGNDKARIRANLEWKSDATGTVIRETRSITHHQVSEEVAAVDWSCRLRAEQDLTLDRTPFTTWGGYGGLILRTSREFHKAHLVTDKGEQVPQTNGVAGDWIFMNGLLDGGRDVKAAFGFVDHPSNPRSPVPWYCRTGPEVNYINAAFLFNEPMQIKRGETLRFNYRVLIRDGHFTADEFGTLAKVFRATTPEEA